LKRIFGRKPRKVLHPQFCVSKTRRGGKEAHLDNGAGIHQRFILYPNVVQDILYSKSDIQINLFYSTDFGVFKNSVLPYEVGTGGDTKPQKEQRTFANFSESPQFAESLRGEPMK